MKSISIERPVCDCGGFAILDGKCADCIKMAEGLPFYPLEDPPIHCQGCGLPIPDPGEYPDPAALLCDACYNERGTEE